MTDVTLATPRLRLEWFSREVADQILAGHPAADWGEGFPTAGELKAARWVNTDNDGGARHAPFLAYTVREVASGFLIGGAGFHGRPVDRSIELGYGLSPSYWGRGYATEAVTALIAAAFASGRVDQVVATTDADNHHSQAVLRRAGFRAENPAATYWITTPVLAN